jgi:hypothetical protein
MGERAFVPAAPRAVRRTPPRRFRAERVARHDPTIEVPFVLADIFANQSRRVLREAVLGLAEAESALGPGGGLPVRSGARPDLETGEGQSRRAVEPARQWGGRD